MYDIQHINSLRGPEHRHISLTLKLLGNVFLIVLWNIQKLTDYIGHVGFYFEKSLNLYSENVWYSAYW